MSKTQPEKSGRPQSKLVLDGVPPRRPLWVRLLKFVAWAGLTGATAAVSMPGRRTSAA